MDLWMFDVRSIKRNNAEIVDDRGMDVLRRAYWNPLRCSRVSGASGYVAAYGSFTDSIVSHKAKDSRPIAISISHYTRASPFL